MKIFGLDISRADTQTKAFASPFDSNAGGWFPVIREPYAGSWQRNVTYGRDTILSFHAVFACTTLIAQDISKLRVKLIQQGADGIWKETTNPAYSPVLRDPNNFQNDHQFWESYILSKLIYGNTYVLKGFDNRQVVTSLYILDPAKVRPLVADDGSIFYELASDNIRGLQDEKIVPARMMIHDRWNCMFHPLVGHSPLFAAAMPAGQGLRIQRNSTEFFRKGANLSGILTAPGHISPELSEYLTQKWNDNYAGENGGGVAVVGDDLKFQQMTMTAVDAQLIEQLRWNAEIVCGIYHVPTYKTGIGNMPTQATIEQLNLDYYQQALQRLIEDAEACLDRGLGLASDVGVEFDLDGLLRMDLSSKIKALAEGVGAGIYAPDEARAKLDLSPVPGGGSPYLQQQNYSLEALAKRDALADPFGANKPVPAPAAPAQQPDMAPAVPDPTASARAYRTDALLEIYRGLQ